MAVSCTFYKDSRFRGTSQIFSLSNDWRYWWVKFGWLLHNEITSFRATASAGFDGNVYGFTGNSFQGDFASLNMAEDWTCWWSDVGGVVNDDIESALLVNRNRNESVIALADLIRDPFVAKLDEKLAGSPARRRGDPRIYANFWPSHDPTRKFVSIEQDLRVEVDWWPDYDARMRYDIYLYLHSPTEVQGYVAWVNTWIEGGVFSGKINDQLHPPVVAGASAVNEEINSQLPLLGFLAIFKGQFRSLYLLPGEQPQMPPPSSNFGRVGNHAENCCLVLTH